MKQTRLWMLAAILTIGGTENARAFELEPLKPLEVPAMEPRLVYGIGNDPMELDMTTVPEPKMDFDFFKSKTNKGVRPYTFLEDQTWVGIPLFVAGIIAKSEKTAFRQNYNNANTKIRLIKYDFHSEWDNYTQFMGPVMTVGLKLAGVEGRSDWPRLFASAAMSYGIMAGFVNGIKYTASELRPDGSTRNSWPSGHTATAFVGATILHKEYGLTRSPWYSVAGYGVATATGVMRVLNNRHWVSDVLSGAGIGILSGELAYGLSDLLFKGKGLLRNDLQTHPDLRKNASFFSVSMGIGFGNKNLDLPGFDYGTLIEDFDANNQPVYGDPIISDPLHLEFRASTAVAAEGAWFFCPYVGVGGRLRVKSTPINGWNAFAMSEQDEMKEVMNSSAINNIEVTIQSDHITEFAADLGLYFNFPLSERFAIGTKALVGRSVMDDIDVDASISGKKMAMDFLSDDLFVVHEPAEDVACNWDYINVKASNSMKFGTGISLTYAHKNNFSWRVFCDYDYSKKTFTAEYNPMGFISTMTTNGAQLLKTFMNIDTDRPYTSSTKKNLHQFVVGGAFCVSF